MKIIPLSPGYAVSGQIAATDLPEIKAAGFVAVICNRPDAEVEPAEAADAIRTAVESAGLAFLYNPLSHGALSDDLVVAQADAMDLADGPVFAYCRSGMRSSVLWALARAGEVPTDELIAAAARGGFGLEPLRAQIDEAARGRVPGHQ